MGKNYAGILGQFTGKVGNVVGAISRGVQTTRIYQPIVNNPNTQKQQLQRQFMKEASVYYQKQCKYFFGDLLKKKYYSTTAYAQIISNALSIIGANRFGTEDRINSFAKSYITKTSLGRGILADIPKGIKSINAGTTGPFQIELTYQAGPLNKVGLSVPVNFYKEVLDSGNDVYFSVYGIFYTDNNTLLVVPLGQGTGGEEFEVKLNADFDSANTTEYKIVDNVVIPTCRISADLAELHTQYYFELPSAEAWTNPEETGYINKIDGKNLGLMTVFCKDSLGNVFSSVNYTLPTIAGA